MPTIQTSQGPLHYDVCDIVPDWVPNPTTIIFHHGIGANLHIWAEWLPLLATRYRLVRYDMRGFGGSSVPPADYKWSFDGLIDDLLAVAETVGARRFHLVGESIGGTAVLAFALRYPERVLSLCLSNAAARGGVVSNVTSWRATLAQGGQQAWAAEMMQRRFYPDALSPALHRWYTGVHETCSMNATLGLADLLLGADLTSKLGDVKPPTLLLAPEASPFIPLEVMASMRAAIPGAELQVFAHSKHGLPLSHGAQCAGVLREFLERRVNHQTRTLS